MGSAQQSATGQAAPASVMLAPGRLIASTLIVLAVLVAMVAAAGYYYREPLLRVSQMFVDSLGGVGIALGFFLPDAFTIPLPNDVVTVLGLAGGMSFAAVCCWATAGSIVGGATGYWVGRLLRRTRVVRRVLDRGDSYAQRVLTKYGATALAVAAITPLPYSIFCWASGAGRIPFKTFLAISVPLRIVRVSGYLYLIQLGLLSTLA